MRRKLVLEVEQKARTSERSQKVSTCERVSGLKPSNLAILPGHAVATFPSNLAMP